jgi:hypothetical protein
MALAALLFALAISVFISYNHFDQFLESHFTLVPASIMLAVGFVFFLAGCMGICILCSNNRGLLFTFGSFLVILLGLLIAAAVCVGIYRGQIDESLQNQTQRVLDEYGEDGSPVTSQANFVQQKFHCCGSFNYTEWYNTPWGLNHSSEAVPESCCDSAKFPNCTGSAYDIDQKHIFEQGCFAKLRDTFSTNLRWLLVGAVGTMVLLVIGVVCTCVLMCYRREQESPYFALMHN